MGPDHKPKPLGARHSWPRKLRFLRNSCFKSHPGQEAPSIMGNQSESKPKGNRSNRRLKMTEYKHPTPLCQKGMGQTLEVWAWLYVCLCGFLRQGMVSSPFLGSDVEFGITHIWSCLFAAWSLCMLFNSAVCPPKSSGCASKLMGETLPDLLPLEWSLEEKKPQTEQI